MTAPSLRERRSNRAARRDACWSCPAWRARHRACFSALLSAMRSPLLSHGVTIYRCLVKMTCGVGFDNAQRHEPELEGAKLLAEVEAFLRRRPARGHARDV